MSVWCELCGDGIVWAGTFQGVLIESESHAWALHRRYGRHRQLLLIRTLTAAGYREIPRASVPFITGVLKRGGVTARKRRTGSVADEVPDPWVPEWALAVGTVARGGKRDERRSMPILVQYLAHRPEARAAVVAAWRMSIEAASAVVLRLCDEALVANVLRRTERGVRATPKPRA